MNIMFEPVAVHPFVLPILPQRKMVYHHHPQQQHRQASTTILHKPPTILKHSRHVLRPIRKATCLKHMRDRLNVQRVTLPVEPPTRTLPIFNDSDIEMLINAEYNTVAKIGSITASPSIFASFEYAANLVRSFTKQLPGFENIDLPSRCSLFASALCPILVSQLCRPRVSPLRFFGLSEHDRVLFLAKWPQFFHLAADIDDIAAAIVTWQPTNIEWALLQTLLIFQEPSKIIPQQAPAFLSAQNLLNFHCFYKSLLLEILKKRFDDQFDLRLRHFTRVFDLLTSVSMEHSQLAPLLCQACPSCYQNASTWLTSSQATPQHCAQQCGSCNLTTATFMQPICPQNSSFINAYCCCSKLDTSNTTVYRTHHALYSKLFHEIFCCS